VELGCWLGQAVWWRRAGLSASQGQPSPVGLIRGPEQEQRATLESLPALRELLAQKSPVRVWLSPVLRVDQQARLVRVSLLPELCTQERPERALVFGKPLREVSTIPRSE
jgi:hypothetical protein